MFKAFNLGEVCSIESGSREKGGASTFGIPSIGGEQISSAGYILTEKMKYITEEHFKKMKQGILKPGDILLVKDGATTGKCAFYKNEYKEAAVNEHVFILRANNLILPRLLYYVISSDKFQSKIKSSIKGIIGGINLSIKNLEISIPDTLEEQQDIVQVLDTMSDIIRLREECISHAQALIPALFQEMFNPYANYTKTALNNLFEFKSGGTPSKQVEEYFQGDIPWITTVALNKLFIGKEDANELITEEAIQKSATKLIPANSLLFGTRVGIGKLAINTVPMCTNQDIVAMIPFENNNLNLIYVYWYLKQINNFFVANGRGATIQGITTHLVKSTEIIHPPLNVQDQFAEKVKEINSYIQEQEEELENAKQMFQSLLHHAFTGKLTAKKYGGN